jgi:hypothetical protein
MTSYVAIATLATILMMTSLGRAESARITAIREELREVDSRAKVIQHRGDHSPPALRREVQRVMAGVARDCVAVSTRLAILALLGRVDEAGRPVDELEAALESIGRRVSKVESWYLMHR